MTGGLALPGVPRSATPVALAREAADDGIATGRPDRTDDAGHGEGGSGPRDEDSRRQDEGRDDRQDHDSGLLLTTRQSVQVGVGTALAIIGGEFLSPQRWYWAAIAALASGKRTAILDLDYHHGNGTQDIVTGREGVRFASLHADPATDYPFFWGHADEVGDGEGRGATLNLPLPHGTGLDAFRRAQATALDAIAWFAPDALVVSFGADTWVGDPISHFALETPDYALLARDIAACGWPTAIVMEGGYAVDALGHNVAGFLSGF